MASNAPQVTDAEVVAGLARAGSARAAFQARERSRADSQLAANLAVRADDEDLARRLQGSEDAFASGRAAEAHAGATAAVAVARAEAVACDGAAAERLAREEEDAALAARLDRQAPGAPVVAVPCGDADLALLLEAQSAPASDDAMLAHRLQAEHDDAELARRLEAEERDAALARRLSERLAAAPAGPPPVAPTGDAELAIRLAAAEVHAARPPEPPPPPPPPSYDEFQGSRPRPARTRSFPFSRSRPAPPVPGFHVPARASRPVAERDGGARLGCATGGPCRVRRLPGSPPFPGVDARCVACFEARPAADFGDDAPELVSVVCQTTGDRASFHALLYANFARQERVPRRELVVFDTGAAPSPFFAALDDDRVRYVHSTDAKLGLGAKRNRCVELAAGAVIACFDDDNVYGPDYLRVMLAHLRHSGARCVCLVRWTTYSVADDAFYVEGAKWSGIHHLRSANGETLVYRKPDRAAPVVGDVDEYPPDRNVDEDRVAMFTALSHDLDDTPANIFLHMEHGRNTVPADSWDNCVEFRTPLDGDRVAAPVRAALAAAASVVEAVARERAARGPTRARPFVPKQRKFAIGKAKR